MPGIPLEDDSDLKKESWFTTDKDWYDANSVKSQLPFVFPSEFYGNVQVFLSQYIEAVGLTKIHRLSKIGFKLICIWS